MKNEAANADETFLFIGGPKDGMRFAIDPNETIVYFWVPRKPQVLPCDKFSLPEPSGCSKISYKKRPIRGHSQNVAVFVVAGMMVDELLNRLVEKYGSPAGDCDRCLDYIIEQSHIEPANG